MPKFAKRKGITEESIEMASTLNSILEILKGIEAAKNLNLFLFLPIKEV